MCIPATHKLLAECASLPHIGCMCIPTTHKLLLVHPYHTQAACASLPHTSCMCILATQKLLHVHPYHTQAACASLPLRLPMYPCHMSSLCIPAIPATRAARAFPVIPALARGSPLCIACACSSRLAGRCHPVVWHAFGWWHVCQGWHPPCNVAMWHVCQCHVDAVAKWHVCQCHVDGLAMWHVCQCHVDGGTCVRGGTHRAMHLQARQRHPPAAARQPQAQQGEQQQQQQQQQQQLHTGPCSAELPEPAAAATASSEHVSEYRTPPEVLAELESLRVKVGCFLSALLQGLHVFSACASSVRSSSAFNTWPDGGQLVCI